MIEILAKMFEGKPEKSTVKLQGKCSNCGCDTTVNITPTSDGFGLMGGALFKSSPDEHVIKCPACYSKNQQADDN